MKKLALTTEQILDLLDLPPTEVMVWLQKKSRDVLNTKGKRGEFIKFYESEPLSFEKINNNIENNCFDVDDPFNDFKIRKQD